MALHKHLTREVTPKAIKKRVIAKASQQPLTVYPIAVMLLGAAYGFLIDLNVLSVLAMGIGALLGGGSWLWEILVRGSHHASAIIQGYREELEKKRHLALADLERDLRKAGDEQGLKQIQLFKEKYQNFLTILGRKLDERELTYQRYLTIAEQVFLGGLDNLENAALAIQSVSAIDVPHIQQQMLALDKQKGEAALTRMGELQARLTLRESQLQVASRLLLENEKALTQLDHVSARIADVKTQQGRAQLDLEDAMEELKHLIKRSGEYSQK